jgi:hypothetical protein
LVVRVVVHEESRGDVSEALEDAEAEPMRATAESEDRGLRVMPIVAMFATPPRELPDTPREDLLALVRIAERLGDTERASGTLGDHVATPDEAPR